MMKMNTMRRTRRMPNANALKILTIAFPISIPVITLSDTRVSKANSYKNKVISI